MKPFDLMAAIKGDKIVTKRGLIVKICQIELTINCHKYITGYLKKENDQVYMLTFSLDGKCKLDSEYDLFMAPKKKKLWICVCTKPNDDGAYETSKFAYDMKDKLYGLQLYNRDISNLIEIEIDND